MVDLFTPKPEHKFTFGLWTVGNVGRDPFGEPVRVQLSPVEIVHLLAEVGAYGGNLHENDLNPIGASLGKRGLAYEHLDQLTVELLLGVR